MLSGEWARALNNRPDASALLGSISTTCRTRGYTMPEALSEVKLLTPVRRRPLRACPALELDYAAACQRERIARRRGGSRLCEDGGALLVHLALLECAAKPVEALCVAGLQVDRGGGVKHRLVALAHVKVRQRAIAKHLVVLRVRSQDRGVVPASRRARKRQSGMGSVKEENGDEGNGSVYSTECVKQQVRARRQHASVHARKGQREYAREARGTNRRTEKMGLWTREGAQRDKLKEVLKCKVRKSDDKR
eukprot:2425673-Pleurochrysis_carterae.AAC.5